MNFKKYIAEFIGTLFLTHIGCGALVMYDFSAGWIAVALAFGLTLMAMTYCYHQVSGSHFNPAVSLGMFIAKKIDFKDFIGYIVAQFLGAIVGVAVLMVFFNNNTGLGANGYGDLSGWSFSWWQALIAEIILTAIFVMVFLVMTSKKSKYLIGIVNGSTLTALYLFGLPLTNASLNPARSFAPAIFTGGDALRHVWLFIVAPLIGAIIAAIGYKMYNKNEEEVTLDTKI